MRGGPVTGESPPIEVIALGTSTGGVEALQQVVPRLDPRTPPVLIAIHIPPTFSPMLAQTLDRNSPIRVTEAGAGEPLQPGRAYVCPGDRHMALGGRAGRWTVALKQARPGDLHVPAVDILFHSLAGLAGPRALAVLMTGMGRDGARGLQALRAAGGHTIAQDEATSVVYGMPKAAAELGAAGRVLPLGLIGGFINLAVSRRAGVQGRGPLPAGRKER